MCVVIWDVEERRAGRTGGEYPGRQDARDLWVMVRMEREGVRIEVRGVIKGARGDGGCAVRKI